MLKILEAAGLPEDNIKMVTLDFSKTDPGGPRLSLMALSLPPPLLFSDNKARLAEL
jgi:hypothetical protein